MGNEQLQILAREIANQIAYHNWEYWLSLLGVGIITAAAGFLGSYFAKRGEHAANKADLDKILNQVQQTTRLTASIQSVVALGEWSERERRTLRRTKLEELILAAHQAGDWLKLETNRLIYLEEGLPEASSPLPRVVMIGKLYFPELSAEIKTYDSAIDVLRGAILNIHIELIENRKSALEAIMASGNTDAGWESAFELAAVKAQTVTRERRIGELKPSFESQFNSLNILSDAAAKLMGTIIAAPP